ncbi:MAG: chloride channel protein [Bacteroidetes bacterium]|nr:chloride channel protein [Bacteroidota bacterium]MBU1372525.1 chloride channel protein [Bacteroidota bacterium]MBU1485066.1 chloride channel protein [Bacteroidota bacterium]MBU1761735.1 chloride channel protein [Bacteroidota bacterium]MBU2268407.1 chloride channel protein [Bacteroidota bacterium]
MKFIKQHTLVIKYLHDHLSRNQFLILSGILVGLTAGFAAIMLKMVVHKIHLLIDHQLEVFNYPYLNLFLPLVGILLTVWVVKNFLHGRDGKGVGNILLDISQRSGVTARSKMYTQMISSALTIGFGGSAGLEGPIAVTGAAIGSNFARVYRLSYRERILLLACGSAAGISAVFNAPITGLMFAIEIILVGVVFSDFIPLIISAVCGALLSKIILDDNILFDFKSLQQFDHHNVPYYLLLGVVCGLVSVYYARTTHKIEHFFHHTLKWNDYSKGLIGGLILALLCFAFPPLFGEGYGFVKSLASGHAQDILKGSFFTYTGYGDWMLIIFVGLICFMKVFATTITLASGGSGGNFAPSLFTGAFLGFFFAMVINKLNLINLPVNNFTLVAMCGILSGVMYAPLTGIFLIAEITGGYELIIPLMLVSTSSYAIAKIFEPYSMDVKHLVAGKKVFTEDYDRNILSMIKFHEIVDTGYDVIYSDSNLGELLVVIRQSTKNIIVCKDHQEKYQGFIIFDKVRKVLLDPEMQQKLTVKELISKTKYQVNVDDEIDTIIAKFEETDLWYIPAFEDGKFVGFISKTRLLSSYRNKLKLTLS